MTLVATKTKVLFYEMHEKFRWNDTKYYFHRTHLRRAATGGPVGPSSLGYAANRIWAWDPETDEVKFLKNRQTGTMTPVDRREFLMVQLQAMEWKNETA
jgi:hypothetical protein